MEALPRPGSRGYRSRRLASEWPPRGLHPSPGPSRGLAAPCPAASGPLLPAPCSPRPAEERRAFPPPRQLGGRCASSRGWGTSGAASQRRAARSASRCPRRDRGAAGLRAAPVPLCLPSSPQSGGLLSLPESLKVAMVLFCVSRGGSASPEGGERWKRCQVHSAHSGGGNCSPPPPLALWSCQPDFLRSLGRCAGAFQPPSFEFVADRLSPCCCQFCKVPEQCCLPD